MDCEPVARELNTELNQAEPLLFGGLVLCEVADASNRYALTIPSLRVRSGVFERQALVNAAINSNDECVRHLTAGVAARRVLAGVSEGSSNLDTGGA